VVGVRVWRAVRFFKVRDFKNQLLCSRLCEEQLVDANSKLVTQAADANQQLRENKVVIEDLRRDVKSYEVKLHARDNQTPQPSAVACASVA
jgi:Na+/phosphate symporter